jgi:hypothetical protein
MHSARAEQLTIDWTFSDVFIDVQKKSPGNPGLLYYFSLFTLTYHSQITHTPLFLKKK